MDSQRYTDLGGNSVEVNSVATQILLDGYLFPTGTFLAFNPIEEWVYRSGQGYVRNEGGTYSHFGYGYFNEFGSYAQYKAVKNKESGVTILGSSISQENFVVPESSSASSSCSR